jgi:hypothetical protein
LARLEACSRTGENGRVPVNSGDGGALAREFPHQQSVPASNVKRRPAAIRHRVQNYLLVVNVVIPVPIGCRLHPKTISLPQPGRSHPAYGNLP